MPKRQHNLTKYFKSQFIIYLLYIILISSLDILVNTHTTPPIDYSILPSIIISTIGYILILIVIWLICLQFLYKIYYEFDDTIVIAKNASNSNKGAFVIIVILFITMVIGLRVLFKNVYSYYNTDYTRYGDIASFMCVSGGLLGVGLILCLQNRSKFIPFKFLDGLVENVLTYDEKERKERQQKKKKK